MQLPGSLGKLQEVGPFWQQVLSLKQQSRLGQGGDGNSDGFLLEPLRTAIRSWGVVKTAQPEERKGTHSRAQGWIDDSSPKSWWDSELQHMPACRLDTATVPLPSRAIVYTYSGNPLLAPLS